MIRFDDLMTETLQHVRALNRGVILSVINELRNKPHITIHDDEIARRDVDMNKLPWPTRFDDKDVQVKNLLSYQEARLSVSIWGNIAGVTLRFPKLIKQTYYNGRQYGGKETYIQTWYEHHVGTEVECITDTDELFIKIEKGYKRYKSKEKKVIAENKATRDRAANERKEMETKGTWGGINEANLQHP